MLQIYIFNQICTIVQMCMNYSWNMNNLVCFSPPCVVVDDIVVVVCPAVDVGVEVVFVGSAVDVDLVVVASSPDKLKDKNQHSPITRT